MDDQKRHIARPGFHDKPVRGLSFAIMVLGCCCVGLGVATLTYALVVKCKYRRYDDDSFDRNHIWDYNDYNDYGYEITTTPRTTTTPFYYDRCHFSLTYSSPGIWSGLMFVVSGVIGVLASRRKATRYIVSMMVLSVVSTLVAVGGTNMAVFSTMEEMFNYEYGIEPVDHYPLPLLILNCIVAFFCFFVFILSWINFGFACHAVCCNGRAGLPIIKQGSIYQYQNLQNVPPSVNYATQPMTTQEGGAPAAAIFQPLPHPQPDTTEPVYFAQGHQVIGMLLQNPQFPVMGNSALQLNSAATKSASPPQLV